MVTAAKVRAPPGSPSRRRRRWPRRTAPCRDIGLRSCHHHPRKVSGHIKIEKKYSEKAVVFGRSQSVKNVARIKHARYVKEMYYPGKSTTSKFWLIYLHFYSRSQEISASRLCLLGGGRAYYLYALLQDESLY